jgi:hypothetical protein
MLLISIGDFGSARPMEISFRPVPAPASGKWRLAPAPRVPAGGAEVPIVPAAVAESQSVGLKLAHQLQRASRTPEAEEYRFPLSPRSAMSHRPAMAHRLYRIYQAHIASLYRGLLTTRSVTSMPTSRFSDPCKPIRLDKCSDFRGRLRWSPFPYARSIALQHLSTSMLPDPHSSCYLPICQSLVS